MSRGFAQSSLGPNSAAIVAFALERVSFRLERLVAGAHVHFLLFYDFVPEYLERRPPYRAEHLRLAWAAHDRGELILGGALAEPTDAAVLLFKGPDDRAARGFAETDPYVTSGLVRRWWVRPWTTVVGETAASPLRSI